MRKMHSGSPVFEADIGYRKPSRRNGRKMTGGTETTVSIASPMLALLQKPDTTYKPEWKIDLLPETRDPQVSLENMRRLIREGLTYLGGFVGPGGVLFMFQTGESFLATGCALGGGPRTEALAQATFELGLREREMAETLGLSDLAALTHWYSCLDEGVI